MNRCIVCGQDHTHDGDFCLGCYNDSFTHSIPDNNEDWAKSVIAESPKDKSCLGCRRFSENNNHATVAGFCTKFRYHIDKEDMPHYCNKYLPNDPTEWKEFQPKES